MGNRLIGLLRTRRESPSSAAMVPASPLGASESYRYVLYGLALREEAALLTGFLSSGAAQPLPADVG